MTQQDNAIVVGIVADLDDPERLGRVRVTYPNNDDQLSNWARIATPMAGHNRGFRFTPEVGDEVLVAHEQGDKRRPYVLGGLWSTADPPPPDDGDPAANNCRFIRSRSGHLVKLDDTARAEKIEIVDQSGQLHVVIDSAAKKIEVTADTGDIDVRAPVGTVTIEATTVKIKASATMDLEAGGALTINGSVVNIN
jgi:phage baseplate assembly protein V